MSGPFTPQEYHDEYRAALEELVASKVEGREVVSPPAGEDEEAEVVDLMEALRRSVAEAQKRRAGGDEASDGPAEESHEPAKAPRRRRAKAG
jgi:DNA end-binding protein Ku